MNFSSLDIKIHPVIGNHTRKAFCDAARFQDRIPAFDFSIRYDCYFDLLQALLIRQDPICIAGIFRTDNVFLGNQQICMRLPPGMGASSDVFINS